MHILKEQNRKKYPGRGHSPYGAHAMWDGEHPTHACPRKILVPPLPKLSCEVGSECFKLRLYYFFRSSDHWWQADGDIPLFK